MNTDITIFNGNQIVAPEGPREARITYYHNLAMNAASVAKFAALACGIELCRAKAELPRMKFSRFVENNCHFSKKTAYRYMAVAGFAFDGEQKFLESKEDASALAQSSEIALDGKSLKDIYIEAGIVKPSATQGGKREGAGRPKAVHDLEAELQDLTEAPEEHLAIANELFTRLMKWVFEEKGFEKIPAKALPTILSDLKQITAEAMKRINVQ